MKQLEKLSKIMYSPKMKQLAIMAILTFFIFLLSGGPAFMLYVQRGEAGVGGFVDNPKSVAVTGLYFLNLFAGFIGALIICRCTDDDAPTKIQRLQPVGWALIFACDIVMLSMRVIWDNGDPMLAVNLIKIFF